jgi:hypothetical protein
MLHAQRVWLQALSLGVGIAVIMGVSTTIGITTHFNKLFANVTAQVAVLTAQNMLQDLVLTELQLNAGGNQTTVYTILDTGTCVDYLSTAPFTLYLVEIGTTTFMLVGEIGVFDTPSIRQSPNPVCTISNTDFSYQDYSYTPFFTRFFTAGQVTNFTFAGQGAGTYYPVWTTSFTVPFPTYTLNLGTSGDFNLGWSWVSDTATWDEDLNTFNFAGPTRFGIFQISAPLPGGTRKRHHKV